MNPGFPGLPPPSAGSSANSPQPSASTSHANSSSPASLDNNTPSLRDFNESDSSSRTPKKSRVQLAPDQPLTTHGKPRERVYVACVQCRSRKVRCDGGKPECFNCSRRTDANPDPCSYDAAPRRRGKDRTAGSRKLAPYIPKKTRTTRSRLEEEAKRNKSLEPGPSQKSSTSSRGSGSPQTAGKPTLVHVVPASLTQDAASAPAAQTQRSAPTQDPVALPGIPSFLTQSPPAEVAIDPRLSQASSASLRSAPLSTTGTPAAEPGVSRQIQRASRPGRTPRHSAVSQVVSSSLGELTPYDLLSTDSVLLQAPSYASVRDSRLGMAEEEAQDGDDVLYLATEPSVRFTRETWWDALLELYAVPPDRPDLMPTLTVDVRNKTSERIAADLRFLFQASLHWLSFINIPRFFSSLFNPVTRHTLQPSLILAALGLATFLQSSEMELGTKGREKALRLIDQARATFDASVTSGWIDVGLVQAAWVLAFFEIQAHPRLSGNRTRESMATLDALVRCLALTTLDVDDPRATVFVPRSVPIVVNDTPPITPPAPMLDLWTPVVDPHADGPHACGLTESGAAPGPWRCGCEKYALGYHWPLVRDLAPQWSEMPMWPKNVSPGEMLKEECRRLAWSSVMLTATQSTKSTAGTDWETQHLWIKDPSNFALLFPGENIAPQGASIASSKDSPWALYMRTLLLWHSSLRMRGDPNFSDADRAQYAMSAWLEIDNIEATLDRHTCMVPTGFFIQLRDILFNTRMVVSHEFQRYIPEATTTNGQLFYHEKAEAWLGHQLYVARYFAQALRNPNVDANDHSRRNFLMFWFMAQISRAIKLWEADHTLGVALDVARTLAPATESLMLLWPCPGQRREYEVLRAELVLTCLEAGVSPPERAIGYGSPGLSSA